MLSAEFLWCKMVYLVLQNFDFEITLTIIPVITQNTQGRMHFYDFILFIRCLACETDVSATLTSKKACVRTFRFIKGKSKIRSLFSSFLPCPDCKK